MFPDKVSPVEPEQDAGLLLPPLEAQDLLRVVWLSHSARVASLSQVLN